MTTTNQASLAASVCAFEFQNLFVENLGWNYHRVQPLVVAVDGVEYRLQPVAEKAGFAVFAGAPDPDGNIPDYPTRRRLEAQVAKQAYENIIIFVDAAQSRQVWHWVKRAAGKPPVPRELRWHAGQDGAAIAQRVGDLEFTLQQEAAGLSITDVTDTVRRALDVERVTKRFYDRFQSELKAFQEFVNGIAEQSSRQWYASLMLNRLMFVYFIQKQGFLDGDSDYLRNRLHKVQESAGAGRFQTFYRLFLRRLFHEGLGQPEAQRDPELARLLGKVPFLNGGLFDVHDLERDNPNLDIPDRAFERVFGFFDAYQWHLDERPRRNDNEINPDVLGYIFEKYINQKQMGAYYTKEDITGYITRNTVIPWLFNTAQRECPVAFAPGGGVWQLLPADPDQYIYPAVGHGIAYNYSPDGIEPLARPVELPNRITAGIDDPAQRADWNRSAPSQYALPTETWRELVARRQRYAAVKTSLLAGEISDINQLITLNLNLERFALEVIKQSEGPELLRAFWNALTQVSILDPACGSGAFLFAALNILEPLYTAAIEGMRGFVADLERSGRPANPHRLRDFQTILDDVARHPSERYYILKSIVLKNLYGVDIMAEATEICRLRLFLKLVAQLQTYDQIEPLPDIDFNIRAGNTLVGFTSLDAVRQAMTLTPDGQYRAPDAEQLDALRQIEQDAAAAATAFEKFRQQQTTRDGSVSSSDKAALSNRLDNLRARLNRHLAGEYGVNANDANAYAAWQNSHQPFHWLVEFHGIMRNGGFDVVIGNPPYVRASAIREQYSLRGLLTAGTPDIYAMVMERGISILCPNGRTGMIVPLSITFNDQFAAIRQHLYAECASNWFASFGRIPSALFSYDTRVRNTIHLGRKSATDSKQNFTTRLHRWFDVRRPTLLDEIEYAEFQPSAFKGMIPKIGSARLLKALERLGTDHVGSLGEDFQKRKQGSPLYFRSNAYNYLAFARQAPPTYDGNGQLLPAANCHIIRFANDQERDIALTLTNGKLMFLWWAGLGSDFNLP